MLISNRKVAGIIAATAITLLALTGCSSNGGGSNSAETKAATSGNFFGSSSAGGGDSSKSGSSGSGSSSSSGGSSSDSTQSVDDACLIILSGVDKADGPIADAVSTKDESVAETDINEATQDISDAAKQVTNPEIMDISNRLVLDFGHLGTSYSAGGSDFTDAQTTAQADLKTLETDCQ